MEFLENISKGKLLGLIVLLVVIIALPLTVYLAQKQQEIRQRAAGEQTVLFFSQGDNCVNPVTNLSLAPGQQTTLAICLTLGRDPINGFDITLSAGTALNLVRINQIEEGADSGRFNTLIFKEVKQDGTMRLAKVTTGEAVAGNNLYLARALFTIKPEVSGTGSIEVSSATITSPSSDTALTVAKPTLSYSITASTPKSFTVSGNCETFSGSISSGKDVSVDFFLDRSKNPDLGIKDSVGGENGGNPTYYLGGKTIIGGGAFNIDLRKDLLNHNSLNPQSDPRLPKEVFYQGKSLKVSAYAHPPGDWSPANVNGVVFDAGTCSVDQYLPVAEYTKTPVEGCQITQGNYSDQDFPNGLETDKRGIDFWLLYNEPNKSNLQTAGARYTDGTPIAENVYLGFAQPNKDTGRWTWDPNVNTLNYIFTPRGSSKSYNPYGVLFTDSSKRVSWQITAFAIGVDALGRRADGLFWRGTVDPGRNSQIQGNFNLVCQKAVVPTPTLTPTLPPGVTPTPTPIPVVTATPTLRPGEISLSFHITMPGTVTSRSIPPKRIEREATVTIFTERGQPVDLANNTLRLAAFPGEFKGLLNLGSGITPGNYIIFIKEKNSLSKRIGSIINLQSGTTNDLPPTEIIYGDINEDDFLNIFDYNILVGCFGPKIRTCGANGPLTDMDDDGDVDIFDFNLLQSAFLKQKGDLKSFAP